MLSDNVSYSATASAICNNGSLISVLHYDSRPATAMARHPLTPSTSPIGGKRTWASLRLAGELRGAAITAFAGRRRGPDRGRQALKTLKVTVIREPVVRVYQRLRHHLRAAEVNQFSAEFSVATITIAVGMVVVTLVVVPTGFIPIVNCLRVETCKWVVFSAPIAISGSAFRQTDFLG